MIRKRFSTRPMPIQRCPSDIGVDVQGNALWTCTAPIPQVAERLGVAPRSSERRCRSGPQGRCRERPPYSACLIRHGDGWDVHGHPTLAWGRSRSINPVREGQTARRDGTRPGFGRRCRTAHRPAGRPTGPPPPRSGARHPSRRDCWCASDPKGSGAGVRKHTRPRPRTRPSDWGGR